MDTFVNGAHIAPMRMKITLPAGYTPSYFDTHRVISVPTVQPGLVDGGDEWLVTGLRHHLIAFANKVAAMHYSVESVGSVVL
jgi:hypothetical protein